MPTDSTSVFVIDSRYEKHKEDVLSYKLNRVALRDLLKVLNKRVKDDVLRIDIGRGTIVDDALRAAGKKKFDSSKTLKA